MSESVKITSLLHAAAEGFEPPTTPDPATLRTRARRRRGAQRAAGVGVAVLALIGTVTVSIQREPARRGELTTAPPATTQGTGATAKDLSAYRWSELPVAPIDPRDQAALVWTGREMVVWGGVTRDGHILADGAAFDPTRSQWRPIAGSIGVPVRYGATSLWTGAELLVVGGQTALDANSRNGVAPAGRGGAYDPAADRWRPVAAGPTDAERVLAAVWTGREAIVVTSERSVAAYDPATDRWRSLSPIPEAAERELVSVVAVWTGGQLLAWALWTHRDISPVTGSGKIAWGIDLFSLDLATGQWTLRPGQGEKPIGVKVAYWTGEEVLIPAAGVFRGFSSGPAAFDRYGLRYDPGTDTYTPMRHGPLDDGPPESYWTGAAIFSLSHSIVTGPDPMDDRDTAAWDPSADRWTRLERAPAGVTYQTPLLWTGREFLSYGIQPARFGR